MFSEVADTLSPGTMDKAMQQGKAVAKQLAESGVSLGSKHFPHVMDSRVRANPERVALSLTEGNVTATKRKRQLIANGRSLMADHKEAHEQVNLHYKRKLTKLFIETAAVQSLEKMAGNASISPELSHAYGGAMGRLETDGTRYILGQLSFADAQQSGGTLTYTYTYISTCTHILNHMHMYIDIYTYT
jgi:hypothetical protein